jgi:hypothetical protein
MKSFLSALDIIFGLVGVLGHYMLWGFGLFLWGALPPSYIKRKGWTRWFTFMEWLSIPNNTTIGTAFGFWVIIAVYLIVW